MQLLIINYILFRDINILIFSLTKSQGPEKDKHNIFPPKVYYIQDNKHFYAGVTLNIEGVFLSYRLVVFY